MRIRTVVKEALLEYARPLKGAKSAGILMGASLVALKAAWWLLG
jgi:hypothetical protein